MTSVFKMKKIRWNQTEDEQLRKYYNDPNLDIIEIGSLMKRSPSGVMSRLERLHIIPHKAAARGYKIVKKMLKEEREKEILPEPQEPQEPQELLVEDGENKNITHIQYLLELLINEYDIITDHCDNIKYLLSIIENEIEKIL